MTGPGPLADAIETREAAHAIAQAEELRLLREFFAAWSELHRIREDARGDMGRLTRMRMEIQAQTLVEAADVVHAYQDARKKDQNG